MTPTNTVLETLGGLIVATGFGGCALSVVRGLRSRSWPSVAGEILYSSIEVSRGARGSKLYAPRVSYAYSVGGREHQGKRLVFGWDDFYTERGARVIVEKYPSGDAADVYYDPAMPWTSVLKPGVNIRTWFATGFLGALLLGILGALVGIFR